MPGRRSRADHEIAAYLPASAPEGTPRRANNSHDSIERASRPPLESAFAWEGTTREIAVLALFRPTSKDMKAESGSRTGVQAHYWSGRDATRYTASFSSARKRKSYSAEPSGGAGRPPDLCDSYNRRRLTDPNRRTYRRASPRETKSGASIVVADLVPTHDRGPGPPGGRSTWLLLSPSTSSESAVVHVAALWAKQSSRHLYRQGGLRLLPDSSRRARSLQPTTPIVANHSSGSRVGGAFLRRQSASQLRAPSEDQSSRQRDWSSARALRLLRSRMRCGCFDE